MEIYIVVVYVREDFGSGYCGKNIVYGGKIWFVF